MARGRFLSSLWEEERFEKQIKRMRGSSSIALIIVGTFRVVSTKYLGKQHAFSVRNTNYVLVNFPLSLSCFSVGHVLVSSLQL